MTPLNEQPIRDAATIVLLRDDGDTPRVLMGQRGKGAVFMPSKFVFPGGRLDPLDHLIPLDPGLMQDVYARLTTESQVPPVALAGAAIRELHEETGLTLASQRPGQRSLLGEGLVPNAAALRFFFRAITPPGRPRRFDARFFLCSASALYGDPDDFSASDNELTHLGWIPLEQAHTLDLPFVTQIVLAEVDAILAYPDTDRPVPFFDNSQAVSRFRAL